MVCPECGQTAVVREAQSTRTSPTVFPMVLLLLGAWVVWQLLLIVCAAQVQLIVMAVQIGALRQPSTIDSTLSLKFFVITLIPAAAAGATGALIALAPFATRKQCRQLASAATAVTCAFGASQGLLAISQMNTRNTVPIASFWGALAAIVGVVFFVCISRLGVSLGRPLIDHVASMYLGPNWHRPRRPD